MKIVITQHECFNLPINIIKRYFELKGETPYFYEKVKVFKSLKRIEDEYSFTENPKFDYNTSIVTKYFGETCTWQDIYSDANFNEREIDRTDENLVKSIEELKPSNLKVVEIPDDVKWYIYESEEGHESIHEEHRTWY